MTTQILEILKAKEYWYNKWRHNRSNEFYSGQYRTFRNKAVSMTRAQKRYFNLQRINQADGDSKQLWRIINEVTGKKTKRVFIRLR